jgi:dienelactone hydrolase
MQAQRAGQSGSAAEEQRGFLAVEGDDDRHDVDPRRIGGLGLSVGGELLLQAAAHDGGLRAVVSDGAGVRSLAEHLHTPGLGAIQRWLTPLDRPDGGARRARRRAAAGRPRRARGAHRAAAGPVHPLAAWQPR